MSEWRYENALGRLLGRQTSLLAGVAVAVSALLAAPNLASAQSGTYQTSMGFISIPGHPLTSFDISWVDSDGQNPAFSAGLNQYFLADRSNAAVDTFPIKANPPVFQIAPTGLQAFAGFTGNNDTSGPNGVIVFENGSQPELWVGDGPTANPACPAGMPMCSTIKVFQGLQATLIHTINTGGKSRADELCVDPSHHVVVMANDADTPPFISFIPTQGPGAYTVVKQIFMSGTPGQGPKATNGIEQCQWDPATNLIYLNLPEVNGAGDNTSPGQIVVIDGGTMSITNTVTVPISMCAGPQGMAIGPRPGPSGTNPVGLGCNSPIVPKQINLSGVARRNSAIWAAGTVNFSTLPDQGGCDEAWFDPGSDNYFFGCSSSVPTEILAIASAFPAATPFQNAFVGFEGTSGRGAHSVAVYSGPVTGLSGNMSIAFVPIPAVGPSTTPAPFSSEACVGTVATALQGCIGLFVRQPAATQ